MNLKDLSSIALLAGLLASSIPAHAYDANGDGMSDVFASHYGLSQDSADEDADGDGFTNREESRWGTDPTRHTPPFTALEPYSSDVFVFRFDSLVGKKYQVEFSGDLLSNWTVLGNTQPGTGNTIAFGSQVLGDQGFWRLAHVGDIDFDGDGLSYVEENLLQSSDSSKDTDQDYILDVNEYLAGTQPAIADPPPVVTIEPAAGDYSDAQSITLTNLALPNYIYYTEDGTEPTLFSRKYDGSAIRTKDHEIRTIRAKVILPDGTESAESAATYRVGGYTQASQTAYYGWVTADGALGYAYDPIEFASGTNLKAPKNHLVVGTGWIINGMFVPDMTVNSQELFYGITGTPTNTTWQSLEGYSTDSSVFYQSGNFRNFRPCGYGWVQRHDQMTADLQRPSQMIYYACIQFEFLSVDYPRQLYTTRAQDQHGNTFYSHKIAQGWVTSHDSMQPDTSIPSSQVRYGVVGSSPAITPVKRVASNHADAIYPTRTIRNLNSVRLGTGWAMGTDGMIPDTREPPQTLYYGEKTSYTYSNSGYERLYSTHPADITPSIARRVVTLGPGYLSSPQMSYDIVWLNNPPRAVYKGTAILNPTQLPPEINFLAYTTSELTGATSMGLGWIANGEFIEYAGTGAFDEDVDNDGLDLSEELALGTNPNYFDTDGDLIPDGFEANSIHLDPLLADPLRGEDFDGDGLDTYEELINGSDPDDFDSDKDSVWDGDEVNYGTDPDDSTSKPFDPYDFVGPSISDPNCEPIGDLGVIVNGGATAGYSVDGTVGDPSVSNSERWRLKFRGRSAESENFGVVDPFSLNLHGGAVFEISLEHVGTDPNYLAQEGVTGPDYDYEATITDMDGFLLSDPDELLGTDSDVDLGTVQAKRAYLAPLKSVSFSQSFTGGDAVGPLYRKIALNGRPLPDKKPEQESETEQYAEETYIDAFDLSLHHDTSYLYLPLASSDLVLQANASARETYWSDRAGLKPHESLTMPFGVGWSSNLCAYVEAVETFTDVVVDPISVNVIDESGRSQRFGTTDMLTFFPWPSSRVDKKTWLNTLVGYDTDNDEVVDRLVYTKKYGTELTYDLCDAWFLYSTDRVSGSNEVKRHRYWRLTEVVDRYGNDLVYDYDNYDENGNFVSENNISLIPVVINSSSHPNQFIAIDRSDNCRRIERITDSRGHTITFNYQDVQVFDTALTQLVSVDYPDKTSKAYGYQTALDVQVDSDSGDLTNHFHCNIHAITDKRGNTHRFSYDFDRSREFYTSSAGRMTFAVNINHLPDNVEADLQTQLDSMAVPSGSAEYKLMYGQPRQVTGVTLPDGLGSARFARTPESRTRYGPEFAAASGTIATDALGNSTVYTFGGLEGEIIDVDDSGNSLSSEWMVYYTQMEVHHGALEGEAGHIGKETFTFDLASGLSLASMTDLSGNTTTWEFGEAMPSGRTLPTLEAASNFLTKWADPSKKIDALNREETYQYGGVSVTGHPFRIMSEINDVHGTVTHYTIDNKGRRSDMTVTDASGTKLREENYVFADEDSDPLNDDWVGFMVEKRVVAYQNLSGDTWEVDLVTQYLPDLQGRVWKKIVDPGGLALTTEFNYDLNNNRTIVTDPRGNKTDFAYDTLNRLYQVSYPSAGAGLDANGNPLEAVTSRRRLFDERGNLACEIDENGNTTLHHYDALSRKLRSIRDMDGLGLPTLPPLTQPQILLADNLGEATDDDIVTEMTYTAVNSVHTVKDPRGTVTKNFYDALQRVRHTYTHYEAGDAHADGSENGSIVADSSEKTHTEFIYETAQNTGSSGFITEGFKPTQIIYHDAVRGAEGTSGLWTLNSHFTYDDVYRATQTRIEYQPGRFNQTDIAYGSITNRKEALVSTVTDALNRDTTTYSDGLGRTTRVLLPDTTDIETSYSSTGLAYETEDELDRISNTEYDGAGRAVLVKAPAVYNALSGSSERPETETIYDAASNIVQSINPLDEVWEYGYDARNRRIKETQPAVAYVDETGGWQSVPVSPEIDTALDGVGNVVRMTDARDHHTVNVYDRANRPTYSFTPSVDYWDETAIQAGHLVTHMVYDLNSNPLEIWQGHSTSLDTSAVVIDRLKVANSYDKLNRLETSSQDVDNNSDKANLIASVNDATDITVTNEHDDAGNRIAVEDGESQRTEFYFDGLSRNTAVHNGVTADFSSTAWVDGKRMVFDALRMTHRLMGTTPTNDALSGFTADADSHITAYGYDSRDRLTSVDYANDASIDRQYTLDAVGNILTVDELDGSTIGTETIADVAYVWDALNRTRAEYSAGKWHAYEYDLAGNRIHAHYAVTDATLTTPQDNGDGSPIAESALARGGSVAAHRSLSSNYDTLNRLTSCTEGSRTSSYRYDLAGNIREKGQANGDVVKQTYDPLGRKEVITGPGAFGSELYVYSHTFDLFGNLARIVETYPLGQLDNRTITNTNDGADRLTVETITGLSPATTTYAYDRANNRTLRSIDDGSTVERWRYSMVSGLNRLDYAWIDANDNAVWATGENRRDYSYNNLGVMTAITGSEGETIDQGFAFDYENRLMSVDDVAASKDHAYSYDYRTRRVLRDESGADGSSAIVSFSGGLSVQEYDNGASTPSVEYIRGSDYGGGIGGILYTLRGSTPSFKHYNSRGDVVAATNASGSLTYQAAYEAFGQHGTTDSSAEWTDGATPLDRQQGNTKDEDGWGALNEGFRNRLLHEGVFMGPDPLGFIDGPNMYTYVVQNPWTKFDPHGLDEVYATGRDVSYLDETWYGRNLSVHSIGTLTAEPSFFGPSSNQKVKLSKSLRAKVGVRHVSFGNLQKIESSDNIDELTTNLQDLVTGGLAGNKKVSTSDLQKFSVDLTSTRKALDKAIKGGDYENLGELLEGFAQVGNRGLFSGKVTDTGKDILSKNEQLIVDALEKSDFVNDLPGAKEHPTPLTSFIQSQKGYATAWGEAESNRLRTLADVVDNAVRIREDAAQEKAAEEEKSSQ